MNAAPFEVPGLRAVSIGVREVRLLQDLLERCAEFHELVEGAPPRADEAERFLRDYPARWDERHVIGLARGDGPLCALLDVVSGWPEPGAWWIGLLLAAPEERGKGLGTEIYGALEAWAAARRARELGLVVQQQNPRARRFWERMGFREVGTALQRLPGRESSVWRMRKQLLQP